MLKIQRVTLYKHGLGFFERSGTTDSSFELEFPRRAMDDVLKSLTVISLGDAKVLGVAFETPPDRNANAQRRIMPIDDETPISSVIAAFAGYKVRVQVGDRALEGELLGLEREDEDHLKRALLAVSTPERVELVPLAQVSSLALLDDRANADLRFALESRRRDEERSSARVRLSGPGEVSVSYIAPAPAWRVSYRVLARAVKGDSEARDVFVQGWGVFDNTLEEDLDNVQLTLTAGMPVSFRYELHQPNTPDRPIMRDDSRVMSAPVEFEAVAASADSMDMMKMAAPAPAMKMQRARKLEAQLEESAPVQASSEARGALFAYHIDAPVSVRRGESGMVPIVGFKTRGSRELLFNPQKTPDHPTSSLRFKNSNLTLERGPAVVLDEANYAGEAVVPFTPDGGELILAFAVELGITVRHELRMREETSRLRFQDGSLFIDVIEFITTIYEAESALANESVLTLEHPRGYNATLETPSLESNLEFARFKFSVPARQKATFEVLEKRTLSRYQDVQGLNGQMLKHYLHDHLLEPSTFEALMTILEHQAHISALQTELQQLERDREQIRNRMNDTRQNLSALDAAKDSKLRTRLVGQLEALEDAMNAFDQRQQAIITEISSFESKISSSLQNLSQ
jgi:molecular chaperone GrpE (heat shock protein)